MSITESSSQKNAQSFTHAEVIRLKTAQLHLSWHISPTNQPVDIYWHTEPNHIQEQGQHLTRTTDTQLVTADPSPTRRVYWRIVTTDGTGITVAERHIPFKHLTNFRDLGGYQARDGRRLKWGLLFRSDELALLMPEELPYLQALNLSVIFDYRSDDEARKKPDPTLPGVRNVHSPVMQFDSDGDLGSDLEATVKEFASQGRPLELAQQFYRELIVLPASFAHLLRLAQDPLNVPLLNHCTAGKDRTGIGMALLLLALDIPEETIIADYLLSNEYREQSNHRIIEMVKARGADEREMEMLIAMLRVDANYLEAAFDEIRTHYGSLDTYFSQCLNLNGEVRTALQTVFLEN